MIKVKVFAVNPFREATYVVSDVESGDCIIVDCGASTPTERQRIEDYISKNELKPTWMINTHGHIDHILGVNYFKKLYSIPFAIDSREQSVLNNALNSAAMFGVSVEDDVEPTFEIDLKEMKQFEFGDTHIQIIHTPGHTMGGVSLFEPKSKTLFTGDTLFNGSIGRTDLPGGDYCALMHSIIGKLLPLGGDVTIYPGHGSHSTLGHEAVYNPFVAEVLEKRTNSIEQI